MAWRSVIDFEGWYEVSDRGIVRSLDRQVADGRLYRGKTLRPCVTGEYPCVTLRRNGAKECRTVHSLVLESFVGPCPPGMEALHGPAGTLVNTWPENLRYGTKSENNGADKHRDGTMWQAVLTVEIVLACRRRRSQGDTYAAMGRDYGVPACTVRRAVIGKTWAHVSAPETREGTHV